MSAALIMLCYMHDADDEEEVEVEWNETLRGIIEGSVTRRKGT